MFFPVLIPVLILALIYGGSFLHGTNQAQANVATFHPAHCLGGWKNVDNIAGSPEVRLDNDVAYDDSNSASLFNSNAQVFCGGFSGDIPYAAKHERVTLNFSWYIGDGPQLERTAQEVAPGPAPVEVIAEPVVEEAKTESGETDVTDEAAPLPAASQESEEVSPAESVEETGESAPVESAEPTAFRFFNTLISTAHAQEAEPASEVPTPSTEDEVISLEPSVPVESVETPLVETVLPATEIQSDTNGEVIQGEISTTSISNNISAEEQDAIAKAHEQVVTAAGKPENAYFEVLYTLDGQEWHTLGFVNRIANDVQIELPIDLFATVEDLEKVQISLHTVERFDTVPKIFLDSLWLEVVYDDVAAAEFVPPGQRPGDIIFSETSYEDSTAVVVLRNVELMTLSNVLTAASSTALSTTSGQTSASSTQATTTATSTGQVVLTNLMSTSTLASIINSTGVLVELWLHSSTTDDWSRIADDSIISRNPQVKFVDGNIFWVDKSNASVWRFNPKSGGYDALSFSKGQSTMQFRNESGELRELDFSYGTSSVQIDTVSEPVME
jgi:hypothetical protein